MKRRGCPAYGTLSRTVTSLSISGTPKPVIISVGYVSFPASAMSGLSKAVA